MAISKSYGTCSLSCAYGGPVPVDNLLVKMQLFSKVKVGNLNDCHPYQPSKCTICNEESLLNSNNPALSLPNDGFVQISLQTGRLSLYSVGLIVHLLKAQYMKLLICVLILCHNGCNTALFVGANEIISVVQI